MPTYEYVCEACGHEFERFQKMSDDPVRKCQECGRLKVRRRISSGGGVGSGFLRHGLPKAIPRCREEVETEDGAKTEARLRRIGLEDG